MARFKLEMDKRFLNFKMRDLFKELIDDWVENPEKGYLKSFYANYGYVSFWYGWVDEEALEKYFKDYVSERELNEIENARNSEDEETRALFSLRDKLYNQNHLFPIVRDHPDVIGEGHAEVHLFVLSRKIDEVNLDEAISSLRKQADKLEKIKDFRPEDDPALSGYLDDSPDGSFETLIIFDPEEEDEVSTSAFELRIRVHFYGDDLLKTVVQKIDKIIEPLKETVDAFQIAEGLPSYHPF